MSCSGDYASAHGGACVCVFGYTAVEMLTHVFFFIWLLDAFFFRIVIAEIGSIIINGIIIEPSHLISKCYLTKDGKFKL